MLVRKHESELCDGQYAMKKAIQIVVLQTAKWAGLFALARYLTARDLRILCYHGAAVRDEHEFRPKLFMTKTTFAARMTHLARRRYPVITLDQAVKGLKSGDWPRLATVITIDDGWFGTYQIMGPTLHRHGYPATLYVATYYLEKQVQVFNVAVDYVLWRASEKMLDLSLVVPSSECKYRLSVPEQRQEARDRLLQIADKLGSAADRQELLRRLCGVLGVDSVALEKERVCSFMNHEEAQALEVLGIDVQLHTHRHRFPADNYEAAKEEIDLNRAVLATLGTKPRQHFCYPSGEYEKKQLSWLGDLGIASATTVKPGFTMPGSSPHELRRFLDGEHISPIEFEAEMSGLLELVRRLRSRARGVSRGLR